MLTSHITVDDAMDAYEWAIGEHSYNDNDRFLLYMNALGFTLDDIENNNKEVLEHE